MKITTTVALFFALCFAMIAPVSAAVSPDIKHAIRLAASRGSNVQIKIDGDTVTLTGYVRGTYERGQVEAAARRSGAKNVINCVRLS